MAPRAFKVTGIGNGESRWLVLASLGLDQVAAHDFRFPTEVTESRPGARASNIRPLA